MFGNLVFLTMLYVTETSLCPFFLLVYLKRGNISVLKECGEREVQDLRKNLI